ncbi:MAG TPA: universal stress protein [Candidatus Aphodovivens avistercoris]|nr:universal stress protein [Candidatus Aphodovivens avistercoris]
MLYDNIMVPYDGSPSARAALEEAAKFAREDPGMVLHIVQIIDVEARMAKILDSKPSTAGQLSSARLKQLHEQAVEEADAALHRQIDTILSSLLNKVVIEFLEEASPGAQIVAYAEGNGCDLIVMGSRGLGALRGMLGSVSNYVLREADIPVMVVKVAD